VHFWLLFITFIYVFQTVTQSGPSSRVSVYRSDFRESLGHHLFPWCGLRFKGVYSRDANLLTLIIPIFWRSALESSSWSDSITQPKGPFLPQVWSGDCTTQGLAGPVSGLASPAEHRVHRKHRALYHLRPDSTSAHGEHQSAPRAQGGGQDARAHASWQRVVGRAPSGEPGGDGLLCGKACHSLTGFGISLSGMTAMDFGYSLILQT
jgi:hypothetical protein